MNVFNEPRYAEAPIKLFFENYVLHVLRLLPEDVSEQIQALDLKNVLGTKSSEWFHAVPEALSLSQTMEVAIWDMWIKTKESYICAQQDFSQFAIDFTDSYLMENTKIDKWTNDSYKAAAHRVNAFIQSAA